VEVNAFRDLCIQTSALKVGKITIVQPSVLQAQLDGMVAMKETIVEVAFIALLIQVSLPNH